MTTSAELGLMSCLNERADGQEASMSKEPIGKVAGQLKSSQRNSIVRSFAKTC